jgi:2-dehydro-3-deoxy-D-arabinonate dehydratase
MTQMPFLVVHSSHQIATSNHGKGNHLKLYRTTQGIFVEEKGDFYPVSTIEWDELIASVAMHPHLHAAMQGEPVRQLNPATILAPVVNQEVWAAGVTYFRSRSARMKESREAGGGNFYDRVYAAERPELFFKATGSRVVGPNQAVRIRSDAKWSVPEPELTLLINPTGAIVGYTIGNDMSARDIEGENPLYLPQAKIYEGSCALGPCISLSSESLAKSTAIRMEIMRKGQIAYAGDTTLAELKREPKQLVEYLFHNNKFPQGVFLMTGTGIVPGDGFTLSSGDVVRIGIDEIGSLENYVA